MKTSHSYAKENNIPCLKFSPELSVIPQKAFVYCLQNRVQKQAVILSSGWFLSHTTNATEKVEKIYK